MEEERPLNEDAPEMEPETPSTNEFVIAPVPGRRPRRVYKGMWGPIELATVAIALLFFLVVVAGYLLLALPETRQLESNRVRRDDLERELREANRKFGAISNTEVQVSKLILSAEDFESRFLQEESIGKTAIYQRVNALINAFGLVNTTGPDYVPIEMTEEERREGTNERTQGGRSRFQSLFPGVYVTLTVEGAYVNVRRFLNEVENSSEFIVISTVELEPSESEGGASQAPATVGASAQEPFVQPETRRETGRTRGKTVSLRLELAAYFQRSNEKKALTDTRSQSPEEEPGN